MTSGLTTTVDQFLIQKQPELMKEFAKAPWSWRVLGPSGMDDLLTLTVYLYFGEKRYEKRVILIIDLLTQEITIDDRN